MKRILVLVVLLIVSAFLFGCTNSVKTSQNEKPQKEEPQQNVETDQEMIKNLVKKFGGKLQNVSLLAPQDVLVKSLEENYADFVAPALLEEWKKNPQKAPGRMVSSPWPDRIEISAIEKTTKNEYKVQGEIIEITSVEEEKGGAAAKQAISLIVKKVNGNWLINEVTLEARAEETNAVVYKNTQYGFNFTLPETWRGYSIVNDSWEGMSISGSEEQGVAATGPIILIRHPQWTSENPRQDIPIMILTVAQWNSMQNEEFHIGAAPIGPKELGRNTNYVFALPARYNYAFPTGFEEVEDILNNNPLQPF
ncbi:hypothetical protein [Bacillus benzoevorans]|uniref:Uncharacterized protein n=1 Tax=Bacillus benzoevorans TaxID=1456 RepID=A0A7X0LWN7_9BACI|nr:hypothetical protein [Bacillus benzoevorans]MBB6446755.1 hypothetical protein [Bacillus benzoevorans]